MLIPRWQKKLANVKAAAAAERSDEKRQYLEAKAKWLEETIVEIIISEAQNEVADFAKWGVDIIPHRARMKQGFETVDGRRVDVESAFKSPQHPFRVAIVCAMWLTGFDVECLSTLYIDKPMKAHTLMQAIAENQLSSMTRRYVKDGRFATIETLRSKTAAWHQRSHVKQRGVDWQFKIGDARVKLKPVYPKIIV